MCTCNENNAATEEYHTAFSELETSTPEEWRTSTRYYDEGDIVPEYTSTPSRRTRREFPRAIPRIPMRSTRRTDLTTGVAIVPRRIDFDALSDVEDLDEEEDLGQLARETLEQLRSAAQGPAYVPEPSVVPETYRVRRRRPRQYPEYMRQYVPRMTRITPCGKCLRM
ncbi:uncharacterized protein [Anoplolepis gracilipes]|uniref:uncharacterized protein n=1 Tax=Anoplolepis gracilipes TaxID=354296 RepID=UPI003BA0B329